MPKEKFITEAKRIITEARKNASTPKMGDSHEAIHQHLETHFGGVTGKHRIVGKHGDKYEPSEPHEYTTTVHGSQNSRLKKHLERHGWKHEQDVGGTHHFTHPGYKHRIEKHDGWERGQHEYTTHEDVNEEFLPEGRTPPAHLRSRHHEFFKSIGLKHDSSHTERDSMGPYERNHNYVPKKGADHAKIAAAIHKHFTSADHEHEVEHDHDGNKMQAYRDPDQPPHGVTIYHKKNGDIDSVHHSHYHGEN